MSKLTAIKNVVTSKAGRGVLLAKKHSPEILMGVGIVGVVGTVVLACKATLVVDEVLDETKQKLDRIKNAKEQFPEEKYSTSDYKKDLVITYTQASVDLVRLYLPAATLGVLSVGCLLGAHNIMKKRNLALLATYKAMEESFKNYRKRVVETYGEDTDRMFKNGIRQEVITVVEEDPETGKKKNVKKTVEVIDPNQLSPYAKFFDEYSVQWSKMPDYNYTFLKCQQNYANDLLHSRGHVFLNEVYDMLGIPRTNTGALVGWVKDGDGDNFVDFGIIDGNNDKKREFVNGYERSILLDFNVDGVIYDLI